MATNTHISEAAPTLAANLVQRGDLWLQPSTGLLKVCLQVDPVVAFSGVIGGGPSGAVVTIANVPAGGTGAAAGGWDTAPNRDAAIASINSLLAALRTKGIIA